MDWKVLEYFQIEKQHQNLLLDQKKQFQLMDVLQKLFLSVPFPKSFTLFQKALNAFWKGINVVVSKSEAGPKSIAFWKGKGRSKAFWIVFIFSKKQSFLDSFYLKRENVFVGFSKNLKKKYCSFFFYL